MPEQTTEKAEKVQAPYEQLQEIMARLSDNARRNVTVMQYQAIGYAWGWQDGAGVEKDSTGAWNFGTAYAIHAAEYEANIRFMRRNIPDAWSRWSAAQTIGD